MLTMAQERAEQNQRLASAFDKERGRLLAFIRKRVPNGIDPDDLLQDVFYELLESYRAMKPIAHAGAWMMQVARNRITDLFRLEKRRFVQEPEHRILAELLPSSEAGPDGQFARSVLLAEIEAALSELPVSQREVFLAHEIEGKSFADISKSTGVSINTLLSRKHYAVKRLRSRLQRVYEEAGLERKK